MLLEWIGQDELGFPQIMHSPSMNLKNVSEYAKPNCRRCHGRGIEGSVDDGSQIDVRMSEKNGYVEEYKSRIAERIYSCSCVDRTLSKLKAK